MSDFIDDLEPLPAIKFERPGETSTAYEIGAVDLNRLTRGTDALRTRVRQLGTAGAVQQARALTEAARDAALAAGKVYPDTATGLAATAEGAYFNVPSSAANESFVLYRKTGGVAVEAKRYPSAAAVSAVAQPVSALLSGAFSLSDESVSGRVVVILDSNGVARVVEQATSTQDARSYARAATDTELIDSLGIATLTTIDLPGYPTTVRGILDSNGALRVIEVVRTSGADPVVYTGAPATTDESVRASVGLVPVAPSVTQRLGIFVYGQSQAVGYGGVPVASTSQPFAHLTFSGGPRASGASLDSEQPLVETVDGILGETVLSSACRTFSILSAQENGRNPSAPVLFGAAPGASGNSLADLGLNTVAGLKFKAQIDKAVARAQAAGQTLTIPCVVWVHGGTDANLNTPRATYRAALAQLQADVEAYVKAATGQTTPVPFVCVPSTSYTINSGGMVPLATDDLCDDAKFFWCTSVYIVPPAEWSDAQHFTAAGYVRLGRYVGRTLKQIILDGRVPDALRPRSATVQGSTLTVRFKVPKGPLVFDTIGLPPTTDMGFRVVDDTGVVPLSGLAIGADGQSVTATLGRALGANPRVRYAIDYTGTGYPGGNGATGNLRDSTAGDWHACVPFERTIYTLP